MSALKIRLDERSLELLKRSVPRGSHCRAVLDSAVHLDFLNVVITCTEDEARSFLLYAREFEDLAKSVEGALSAAEAERKAR